MRKDIKKIKQLFKKFNIPLKLAPAIFEFTKFINDNPQYISAIKTLVFGESEEKEKPLTKEIEKTKKEIHGKDTHSRASNKTKGGR